MTVVPPGSKVLVSGANGFIAVWVVRTLLERGHYVRGTVRSAAKGEDVVQVLTELCTGLEKRFEYIVVEDITKEGAFDEAVKGVDAIEHTASPVSFSADDPQDIIIPAVHGTQSILKSAMTFGTEVKRVVMTSSVAAVFNKTEPAIYTEEDWNEPSLRDVQVNGRAAAGPQKYRASKVLAERAAWDFVEKNKDKIKWDLVVLNPPMVYGPAFHLVTSPENLGLSLLEFWKRVIKCDLTDEELVTISTSFIDVRDLAEAHARALEKSEASNHRILISSAPYVWQDWLNAANAITPPIPGIRKGRPEASKTAVYALKYDTSKMKRLLGMHDVRDISTTMKDVAEDYRRRGWLNETATA